MNDQVIVHINTLWHLPYHFSFPLPILPVFWLLSYRSHCFHPTSVFCWSFISVLVSVTVRTSCACVNCQTHCCLFKWEGNILATCTSHNWRKGRPRYEMSHCWQLREKHYYSSSFCLILLTNFRDVDMLFCYSKKRSSTIHSRRWFS